MSCRLGSVVELASGFLENRTRVTTTGAFDAVEEDVVLGLL